MTRKTTGMDTISVKAKTRIPPQEIKTTSTSTTEEIKLIGSAQIHNAAIHKRQTG